MKHLVPLITGLFFLVAFPGAAQQTDLITLNDASPAIDVVITLPPDSTGTIALDFALAAVKLTDENNAVVFQASDERLHGLKFNIAPNSGSHTLTVERLPGTAEAYVRVESLADMPMDGTTTLVSESTVTLNQETDLTLNADTPGGSVAVTIPQETTGVLTATFPSAYADTRLVDSDGVLLVESIGGHVDGMTAVLDAGEYQFNITGNGLTDDVLAGVRVVSVDDAGVSVVDAPIPTVAPVVTSSEPCTATVNASSVNVRSGPGTGYSILGYTFRGDTYPIGGQNPENNWAVIANARGDTGWVAIANLQLTGDCTNLTVFDIPLRDAEPAQITTSPRSDDEHESHESGEHEDHEGHEDDD